MRENGWSAQVPRTTLSRRFLPAGETVAGSVNDEALVDVLLIDLKVPSRDTADAFDEVLRIDISL